MRITRTWKRWFIIGLGAALALAPTLTAFAGSGGGWRRWIVPVG